MDLQIKGKKYLITGGSKGIGKGIARKLLEEGAFVCIIARNKQTLENTTKEFKKKFGERILFFKADCTKVLELEKTLNFIVGNWNALDGVIANVGDGRSVPDALPSPENWNQVWNVNFNSALYTTRVFYKILQENNGNLLFISSITGIEAFGAPVDYSTAKTALISLAKNMARKTAPNVRINVIAPGNIYFKGGSWDDKMKQNKKRVENIIETTVPMKRFGTPEDIANAAAFILSPLASFITGTVLRIDGGQTVSLF